MKSEQTTGIRLQFQHRNVSGNTELSAEREVTRVFPYSVIIHPLPKQMRCDFTLMVRSHQAKANAMSLSLSLEWLCKPFKWNRFRFHLVWRVLHNLLDSIWEISHSLYAFAWCEWSISHSKATLKTLSPFVKLAAKSFCYSATIEYLYSQHRIT